MGEKMTYAGVGVNYDLMDPFKRMAQLAGKETAQHLKRFGFEELEWTRGESVYVIETPLGYFGLVIEGLGTKNLVADAMRSLGSEVNNLLGVTFYSQVEQCNAAMAFNDMITLGLRPVVYGQYLAVGSSDWFKDEARCRQVVVGTKRACDMARCSWGGGETPTLRGVIFPEASDLAGGAFGFCPKDQLISPQNIRPGDAIIFVESSGIHANGLTLAREIAANLPEGYLTKLPDGRTYGETLLDPTYIYVGLIDDCLNAKLKINYVVNITGHGWRKLMRAPQPFTYVIEEIPLSRIDLPIFDFIQKHGSVADKEIYGNLNMGAGTALYVHPSDVKQVISIAEQHGLTAFKAGYIEKGIGKKVVIKPKNLEYLGETLGVR